MSYREHTFVGGLCCRLLLVLLLFCPVVATAQESDAVAATTTVDTAAVERLVISLVTCEPFNKIYSLYGHTGLRIYDPLTGRDLLANWGIFNMRQRFFALRFVLGLTDYSMDIETWEEFCWRYRSYGCGIYEQVLDMTWDEKLRLCQLVDENYLPANRTYRYNYFYDNCTTRVRDIIEASIDGKITYTEQEKRQSWRTLVHAWTATHLWAQWGDDYLLGFEADRLTTPREAQFLPFNLSGAVEEAVVAAATGGTRPLVATSHWVLPPRYDKGALSGWDRYVASPTGVAMAYVLVFLIVVMIEKRYHRRLWQLDITMLAVTGIMGLLLLAMVFSQHPTVRLNAQILIFDPLSLPLLYPIAKTLHRGETSTPLLLLTLLTGVGLVCGMTIQHYAEGVMTLALFLLLTYMRHISFIKNEKTFPHKHT